MNIQGSSDVSYALQVKSAQMANSQQEQQGEAVLELLESAESVSVSSSSNVGSILNTYA